MSNLPMEPNYLEPFGLRFMRLPEPEPDAQFAGPVAAAGHSRVAARSLQLFR